MIQSLLTNNKQQADRINTIKNQKLAKKYNTIEKDNLNMTGTIQSMSKGAEKLSERIHTVKFDNQNLLKNNDVSR